MIFEISFSRRIRKTISFRNAEPFRGKVDFGPVGPIQNWTGPNIQNLFKFVCQEKFSIRKIQMVFLSALSRII